MAMKKSLNRAISALLSTCLIIGLLPLQAMAYQAERDNALSIQTKNGAITPDDTWEETFPYGAFAIGTSSLTVKEGERGTIKLYRLGGTTGRATVLVRYAPVIYANEDMSPNHSSALSSEDVTIRVEDTQPAAQYQPIGKAPEPLEPGEEVVVRQGAPDENGDVALTISADDADGWQWYLYNADAWRLIGDATESSLKVAARDLTNLDFRCVYTVGGVSYCSDALSGASYVRPTEEVLEERPADVPLWADPTYRPLAMKEADPYSGYDFAVTFAEGEWVKELQIDMVQDDVSEADEFATFLLAECNGGEILDAASTLSLRGEDDEPAEASEIGFAVTEMRADKSAGTAEITVRRTGGTQNVLSVDYATADGTATAGKDYVQTSGRLAFYAGISELTIKVALIDDKRVTEDTVDFSLALSNLLGDAAGVCALGETSATVSLYNTATGTAENLATVLFDESVVDVSGSVAEHDTIAAPSAGDAITGEQQEQASSKITIAPSTRQGGIGPRTFDYPGKLSFSGGNWSRQAPVAAVRKDMYGYDKGPHSVYTNDFMNEMFDRIYGTVHFEAGMKEDAGRPTCSNPYFRISAPGKALYETSSDAHLEGGSSIWGGGTLYYTPQKGVNRDFALGAGDDARYLQFGQYGINGNNLDNKCGSVWTNAGELYFNRRYLSGNIALRIYTANDSDSAGGGAVLTVASGVYDSIKPTITFADGGAYYGSPYVGSTLRVDIPTSAAFSPATQDANLDYALFLTNAQGDVKLTGTKVNGANAYTIPLVWQNMTEAELMANYTLCLVMTRKQSIEVDVSPSVPRLVEKDGTVTANIDETKINETAATFLADANIEYGYTPIDKNQADRFAAIETASLSDDKLKHTDKSPLLSSEKLENLQWVNFHLPAGDKLLLGGVIYDGDARIPLKVADLSSAKLTFRYYQKDYAKVDSVMTTSIDRTALYLDANTNGQIDGYFNTETGYFVLTEVDGVSDKLVMYLEDGVDYDESIFAPQPYFDAEGKVAGYAQHFLKAFYTMTPRNLQTPENGQDARAQVLPSFITDATGAGLLGRMTEEQKSYRYIVSGRNRSYAVTDTGSFKPNDGDYARSADNHLMYGSAAGKLSCIDIPLGGDVNPVKIEGETVTWAPQFKGSLLYPFAYPSPIKIEHSLAGSNIPLAKVASDESERGWSYIDETAALAQINGYLGSYVFNDTYALSVQEQTMTTDDIAAANGRVYHSDGSGNIQVLRGTPIAPPPMPESTNRYYGGLYENADYLKVMSGTDSPDIGVNSADKSATGSSAGRASRGGGGGGMFDMDVGTKLPAFDFKATDYISVTVDGYEVGFSIGVPLGGYNSNGDAGTGGVGSGGGGSSGSKWFGPGTANKSNAEDMGKLKDFLGGKHGMGNVDDSWGNATKATDPSFKSSGFKVGFSVGLAFLFKYDPVSNVYQFNQFTVSIAASLEFTYQYRLSFFPIAYVFVTLGASLEITTGLTVDREVHEMSEKVKLQALNTNSGYVYGTTIKNNDTVKFDTQIKAFNIVFSGKLYLDYGDDERSGIIESDGSEPVLIVLAKQSGAKLEAPATVSLTALDDESSITRVAKVDYSNNNTHWNGVEISPSFMIEAGIGIGVTVLKLEFFIKFNVGVVFLLGIYEKDYDGNGVYTGYHYNEAEVSSFNLSIGVAVRAVLGVLSFEMDLIRYSVGYEKGEGWSTGWGALGDRFGSLSRQGGIPDGPVTVSLLGSTAHTQQIYTLPQPGGISTFAFDPTVKGAPFQLSGYGSSGDAFKLVDGLITGYDYRVVTVDDKNYMVYTISRKNPTSEIDNMMLVLSEIKVTTTSTNEAYGLVNPLDEENSTPYIVLDNDGTGDLGFSVWTEGTTIHAAWVSYKDEGGSSTGGVTAPSTPCPDGMTKYNYEEVFGKQTPPTVVIKPTAPTEVPEAPAAEKPTGGSPTAPVEAEYYVSAADYTAEAYPDYVADSESSDTYYNPKKGASYAAARAAYAADTTKYASDLATYNAANAAWLAYTVYQKYLSDKAQYDIDKAAYDVYAALKAVYDNYKAWYDYFAGNQTAVSDARTKAYTAAKNNTLVKTASFDTADTEGFTSPAEVSTTGASVYLPDGAGGAVVYAKAVHYTDEEITQKSDAYRTHLNGLYGADGEAQQAMTEYGLQTALAQWQITGKYSQLYVKIDGQEIAVALADVSGANGQIVENIDVMKKNASTYYVVYTTGLDSEQPGDVAHIRRLYLRTLTLDVDGTTWKWGTARLLRTIVDYDKGNTQDGLYGGSALQTAYENPYFANLQFLNGVIGDKLKDGEMVNRRAAAAAEDFLLFEMNGAVYVIKADSLDSILSDGTGTIYPFFKAANLIQPDGTTKEQTSIGRTAVTIGADSAGGIAAVYVGPVSGTVNNAVYLSRFDPHTGKWSAGTMLAMRGMQIHEDGISGGWSAEELEKAYLADANYNDGFDALNQFTFSNLQMAMGVKVISKTTDDDTTQTKDTLLVLTQGAMLPLEEQTATDGSSVLIPKSGANADMGVYALSYGIGGQGIGEDRLTFPFYQFTAGSELYPTLSFANTGDVGIRGSEKNPITVKLMVQTQSGDTPLGTWTVKQSIRPGETVKLNGKVTLASDLAPGSVFYITVEEDKEYIEADGGKAFSATTLPTGTLTVESKPELGFERFNVTPKGVDKDGNTILEIDFQVGNRGGETAENVYVQFQYEDGADKNGNATYAAMDITNAALTVSKQEPLPRMLARGTDEKANGILYLQNAEDGGDLEHGKGRTVSGTLLVPPGCYKGADTNSLNLKVEIFSNADTLTGYAAGARTVRHGEYDLLNNVQTKSLEHSTYISAPDQITLAMGNTLRLPISAVSTTGLSPALTATEVASTTGEPKHLGILYYNMADKTAVIVPTSEGSGILHLYDAATNTTKAVAYTVTAQDEGVNIYKDNHVFAFMNANGTAYDETKPQQGQTWTFEAAIPAWGTDNTAPSRGDLAKADTGSKLTFKTVAERIDLSFLGSIRVESSFPGFAAQTYTCDGGSSKVSIPFGDNAAGFTHTVTITAVENTQFDKLVEHYAGGAAPTPTDDANAPHIYWSRSFPDTASISIADSGSITLTCYVLDDTGLSALTLGGAEPGGLKKNSDGFWQFDVTLTGNQTLVVDARDQSGNRTVRNVTVDWFAPTVSAGASSKAPTITAQWMVREKNADAYTNLPADQYVTAGALAAMEVVGNSSGSSIETTIAKFHAVTIDDSKSQSQWEETPIDALADQNTLYPASQNGIYQAMVTDARGAWATVFVLMGQLDSGLPAVLLRQDETALHWSATKSETSASTLTEVLINGAAQSIRPRQSRLAGSFPITFGGTYELQAKDGAGNIGTQSLNIEALPLHLGSDAIKLCAPWNSAADNGSLALDYKKVTGGIYEASRSNLAENSYFGKYEFALSSDKDAPKDGTLPQNLVWKADIETLDGLTPGAYTLYVRDASKTDVFTSVPVIIGNAHITYTTAIKQATPGVSNGAVYVTAAGGKDGANLYQFAIIPKGTGQTALAEAKALTGWQTAGMPLSALNEASLTGLAAGEYQLGVRPMAGVTADELVALGTLYDTMTAAQVRLQQAEAAQSVSEIRKKVAASTLEANSALQSWQTAGGDTSGSEARYKALIDSNPTVLAALDAWTNAAPAEANAKKAAYDAALSAYFTNQHTVAAASAKVSAEQALGLAKPAYEAQRDLLNGRSDAVYASTPALWENAATGFVSVTAVVFGGGAASPDKSLTYNETDKTVTVTFPGDEKELSEKVQEQLIKDNATYQIIVRDEGLYVRIPIGTLTTGDHLSEMLVRNDGTNRDLSGCVIVCTDSEGVAHTMLWSSLTESEFSYVASIPGTYRVVDAGVAFDDVSQNFWGRSSIAFVTARGLFKGTDENSFTPNGTMTRGMFVTVLGRLAEIDTAAYAQSSFSDVSPTLWYGPYVGWASKNGIVGGGGDGTFRPNDPVTREQMCAILMRYLQQDERALPTAGEATAFVDGGSISAWARDAVAACQEGGLIQGTGGGNFQPKSNANRAQVATIFTRLIQALIRK